MVKDRAQQPPIFFPGTDLYHIHPPYVTLQVLPTVIYCVASHIYTLQDKVLGKGVGSYSRAYGEQSVYLRQRYPSYQSRVSVPPLISSMIVKIKNENSTFSVMQISFSWDKFNAVSYEEGTLFCGN